MDEFTGRTMPGRRWSDGLHQAIEAKEGVPIQAETVTLASISYQNFFRTFPKLGGMTGTAATEVRGEEGVLFMYASIFTVEMEMRGRSSLLFFRDFLFVAVKGVVSC